MPGGMTRPIGVKPEGSKVGRMAAQSDSHADPAPLVLSEAREAGCAIVATNVDGIPELLEHGQAGILVPARDRTAL
jgi:glycosyltransferase involved in cell wall biosynthesis